MKSQSEEQLQAECFQWFHNNHPKMRGRLLLNFNNPKNAIQGAHLKAMGLQAGTSDHVLLTESTPVWLECKLPSGRPSKVQIGFQAMVTNLGHDYFVYRSLSDFKEIISKYTNE